MYSIMGYDGSVELQHEHADHSDQVVLLLRPFRKDAVPAENAIFAGTSESVVRSQLGLAGFLVSHFTRTQNFANSLAEEFLRSIGRLVQIENPVESQQKSKHLYSVSAGQDWREIVRQLATDAVCIVVLLGDSPGLLWEFEFLRQNVAPGKVFFLTELPDAYSGEWNRFREATSQTGIVLPINDPGPGTVISFGADWKPRVSEFICELPSHYVSNILHELETGPSEAEGLPRSVKWEEGPAIASPYYPHVPSLNEWRRTLATTTFDGGPGGCVVRVSAIAASAGSGITFVRMLDTHLEAKQAVGKLLAIPAVVMGVLVFNLMSRLMYKVFWGRRRY